LIPKPKETVGAVGGIIALKVKTQHSARAVKNPDWVGILNRPADQRVYRVASAKVCDWLHPGR
jgi:hypothetical protein